MAFDNAIIIIGIGYLITYLILYKKNKLFGNISFMGISLSLMAFSVDNTNAAVGLILFLGFMINTIYDIIIDATSKRKV